jgi:carboxyl-terminal processing protease
MTGVRWIIPFFLLPGNKKNNTFVPANRKKSDHRTNPGQMKLSGAAHSRSLLAALALLSLLASCRKDDDDLSQDAETQKKIEVSEWLYDWMKDVYFWNETFPATINIEEKTDPEAFFYELTYDAEDKWSYITDDWKSLESELSGTPVSMGYSPAFCLFPGTSRVFIIVEYVYPGSPSNTAGLKRGDIILTINGETLDTSNYYDLYSQSGYTAGLGTYANNTITPSGVTITMTAASFQADPLIFDSVFTINGTKIGYMVYTEFISGENDQYLATLDRVFDQYKSNGISDVIIDLRYNPGGEIDASGYLASAIAPYSVVSSASTFVTFLYNKELQSYFEKKEGPESENLVFKFPANSHNMNLSRVYFLTTYYSASASELLIVGLRPYMDVVVVGEPTYGKYTGMWVIYDPDEPPAHNWAILPIVTKFANALGYTDFKNGLEPDIAVEDNLLQAKPFGNTEDPIINAALEDITGISLKSARSAEKPGYVLLDNGKDRLRRNVFIPGKIQKGVLNTH